MVYKIEKNMKKTVKDIKCFNKTHKTKWAIKQITNQPLESKASFSNLSRTLEERVPCSCLRDAIPTWLGYNREGTLPRSHKMARFNRGDLEHTHSAGS